MRMAAVRSKRQDIIDAAIRLMAEKGATGLTAAALATEAGVSKANIFHHFPTLDDVVLAAFEQFLRGMEAFTPQPGTDLRGWLEALGAETVDLIDEQRLLAGAYFAFAGRAHSDERLRQLMAGMTAAVEADFAAAIGRLAPGRFNPEETAALAALILVAGDGLAVHRHLFPERANEQQAAWRALVDRIAPADRAQEQKEG
jgi:AcrR family transcriptional regulator